MTGPGIVWVSPDASGDGWFIDPNPAGDSAFTGVGNRSAGNRMDLLSVMAHELGHVVLAMDESPAANDVMTEALPLGVRRMPTPDDLGRAPSAAWSSSHSGNGLREVPLTAQGRSALLLDGLFASELQAVASWQASQVSSPVQGLRANPLAKTSAAGESEFLTRNPQATPLVGLPRRATCKNTIIAAWETHYLDDHLLDELARVLIR